MTSTTTSGRASWTKDDQDRLKASFKVHNGKMAEIRRSSFPNRSYDDVRNQCVSLGLRNILSRGTKKRKISGMKQHTYILFKFIS